MSPELLTAIARAAEVLRRGGLVAFPTETVYGLGANALDPAAVASIFRAKGRPSNNPLIVHVAEASEALRLVSAWPATAAALAERFWPGPLTLVLPKADAVPSIVTAGGPTVAVRVPAHPIALALLRAADLPVAAPSANRSGQVSPTRAEHVRSGLGGLVEVILDGGPTAVGLESTVLDLCTSPPRLLRPGHIGRAELEAIIGPVALPSLLASDAALPSPGLLARHYAPRTPLECTVEGRQRVEALHQAGLRVGWLTRGRAEASPGVFALALPSDPADYAAGLYAALHTLDAAGLDRLVADLPPDGEDWAAVRDRLCRASA